MWRSLFLAIGVFLLLLGAQCLGVSRFNLKLHDDPPKDASPFDTSPKVGPQKQFTPKPWTPWSLMSTGAVVCLYSFTIPRRVAGA